LASALVRGVDSEDVAVVKGVKRRLGAPGLFSSLVSEDGRLGLGAWRMLGAGELEESSMAGVGLA
jgi:hypothetical protein